MRERRKYNEDFVVQFGTCFVGIKRLLLLILLPL